MINSICIQVVLAADTNLWCILRSDLQRIPTVHAEYHLR